MKYLKKWNENTQSNDVEFIITKIGNEFTSEKVNDMIKTEISEWVDDESEYEDINNGEAQDVVISQMISWFKNKHGDIENEEEVIKKIKEIYKSLA